MRLPAGLVALWLITGPSSSPVLEAASARTLYAAAQTRERTLRSAIAAGQTPTIKQFRAVIAAYNRIVLRFPASGYSDNALWQAASLASDAYARFRDDKDRRSAILALQQLSSQYPSSSLVVKARAQLATLDPEPRPVATSGTEAAAPRPLSTIGDPDFADDASSGTDAADGNAGVPAPAEQLVTIRSIRRTILPDVVRVTLELDNEVAYREERLSNPARMFVDLRGTRPSPSLTDRVLMFEGDAVRQIKIGRHPQNTTRIVVDLQGVTRYSVFTLYNPFRLVVDCERPQEPQTARAALPATAGAASSSGAAPPPASNATVGSADSNERQTSSTDDSTERGVSTLPPTSGPSRPTEPAPMPIPATPSPAGATAAPASPSANLQGGFSLARQLGLGVSRIVIDAGHGGHDPGAQGRGLSESDLVLDIALRLEKRFLKQPGIEVILTRRTDVYVPLEERTAIANRASADLFLSIHANASRNERAHGIETYYLNFASNPDAEAVAARENSASGGTMSRLPDIVKAIALNNKLDESRDFATFIQRSMIDQLRAQNKLVRDLGVRQAPFVVLIGASMPSVLAEVSFVTNRQEVQLLKSPAYRQRIAEALLQGVLRYQKSLKKVPTVASGSRPE